MINAAPLHKERHVNAWPSDPRPRIGRDDVSVCGEYRYVESVGAVDRYNARHLDRLFPISVRYSQPASQRHANSQLDASTRRAHRYVGNDPDHLQAAARRGRGSGLYA